MQVNTISFNKTGVKCRCYKYMYDTNWISRGPKNLPMKRLPLQEAILLFLSFSAVTGPVVIFPLTWDSVWIDGSCTISLPKAEIRPQHRGYYPFVFTMSRWTFLKSLRCCCCVLFGIYGFSSFSENTESLILWRCK